MISAVSQILNQLSLNSHGVAESLYESGDESDITFVDIRTCSTNWINYDAFRYIKQPNISFQYTGNNTLSSCHEYFYSLYFSLKILKYFYFRTTLNE